MTSEVGARLQQGRKAGMSSIRALLVKALRDGLTPSEAIHLKGELARLESRVAAVNARAGREVVRIGPYARLLEGAGVSAVAL